VKKTDGRKKYDREYLVAKIAMMRIKGKSTYTILEFLMETVGMSRKIAYDVLQDAQKYIMEQTNEDTKVAFAEAIQRLEELYENGTDKVRLDVLKEMNKLRGLYAAQKVDITSAGEAITEIKLIQVNKKEDLNE
jgi:protein-disulfide isomerase-like protein with CxxC motif